MICENVSYCIVLIDIEQQIIGPQIILLNSAAPIHLGALRQLPHVVTPRPTRLQKSSCQIVSVNKLVSLMFVLCGAWKIIMYRFDLCCAFRTQTGPVILPVEGGPVDLRRRSTFMGLASSGPMQRLTSMETQRRPSSSGPPPVAGSYGAIGPFARRFSVSSPLGISERDTPPIDTPTPPTSASPPLLQRKMSSPTPKIPESFLTKKRITQNKEKRDSL